MTDSQTPLPPDAAAVERVKAELATATVDVEFVGVAVSDLRTLLALVEAGARDRERLERFIVDALNDDACADLLRSMVTAGRNGVKLPTALAYWTPFERLTAASRPEVRHG